MKDTVLVVDYGGQYAHLIARRLRDSGYYSLIAFPEEIPETDIYEGHKIKAIILSGGPSSVYTSSHPQSVEKALSLNLPVLGICYGHQLLAHVLGGQVGPSPKPEFGPTEVEILARDELLEGLPRRFRVWMSHNDAVLEPPPGAKVLATSSGSPVAAFRLGGIYGLQWHPEVEHTQYGSLMLRRFASFAGLNAWWNKRAMLAEIKRYLEENLPPGEVAVSAVSGGVDSTIATLLAMKYGRSKIVPILIDTGLLPEGELESSLENLGRVGIKPKVVDASDEFISALANTAGPEEKRRRIGWLYGFILEREARSLGATRLIQGTIYPDVIESGARHGADTIKTHHNVGGLPQKLGLKLVEPLRHLYKDEVRKIAVELGVPREVIWKKPVPGPGLAVRVEGVVTREKLRIARRADAIFRRLVEEAGLSGDLWQYFAILSSSRATGVKGDRRSYGYVVVLRAVSSSDAMTADVARLPWDLLIRAAKEITSEIPEVTRVVYDVTTKPPATIEWE